jgi:DNA-binding response OmpR family regulator
VRVLIIEDEKKVADALKEGLGKEGFETDVAYTGEDGFFLISANRYDVIVLDWMLPGRDGLEVLSFIRKLGLKTPVLFLTARDSIEDRTTGLNKGADDYLVKPFAFSELVARIRALLRRTNTETSLHLIVHDLEMDLIARKVARNGEQIVLTAREFQLLEYLVRHQTTL